MLQNGSALGIMFNDPIEVVRLPNDVATLTPESIAAIEKAAAESRRVLDEKNAKFRAERGHDAQWLDELAELQARFKSHGTVGQAKEVARGENERHAAAVKELTALVKKCETLLAACDLTTRGVAERKLERLRKNLADALRLQDRAKRLGESSVRSAREFEESGQYGRLIELRERQRLHEQTLAELKNL